jgi:hypothetical protein
MGFRLLSKSSAVPNSRRLGVDRFEYLRDVFQRIRMHPPCHQAHQQMAVAA